MQLEDFVIPFISLVGIPLLVVSAVRSLWKLPKISLRKVLFITAGACAWKTSRQGNWFGWLRHFCSVRFPRIPGIML